MEHNATTSRNAATASTTVSVRPSLQLGSRESRICFLSGGGTAGDVRPLISLALALRARGFDILFVGDEEYKSLASSAGISASEWFSFTEAPQGFMLRTTAGQRWLWEMRPRLRDYWIRQEFDRESRRRIAAFWRLLSHSHASRIVAAVGSISAHTMLFGFGPSCAKIISCPMPYPPSKHFTLDPPDFSFFQRLKARRERRRTKSNTERFCKELYHLVSASSAVFPRPGDWLPNMQVTGYIPFDGNATESSPPGKLVSFLGKGPPPVYVGFGSVPFLFGRWGERLAKEIITGCRRRKLRCVIQSSDLSDSFGSEDVFILDSNVSHAWLFPQCSTIVFHGGYGTLHTALVARRTVIIYPFHSDEFLWATRMGELGVGPGFTARVRDISAAQLERDLAFVLTEDCQMNANRLGSAVESEQGLHVQVAAVESIIEHTSRGRGGPLDWQMPRLE